MGNELYDDENKPSSILTGITFEVLTQAGTVSSFLFINATFQLTIIFYECYHVPFADCMCHLSCEMIAPKVGRICKRKKNEHAYFPTLLLLGNLM